MSVSFSEIIAAANLRKASLAAEVAGYLALSVADQVQGAPRRAKPSEIVLGRDGGVRVNGGAPASAEEAESGLRELLLCLLEQASSVTPALVRSGKRPAQHGVETLIRELETALIPVNRGAAKRALARLYRDVNRVRESGVSLDIVIAGRAAAPLPASVLPPPIEPAKSVELPEVLFAEVMEASMPVVAPLPVISEPEPTEALVTSEPVAVEIPVEFSPTPPPPIEEIDVELDVVTSELVVAPPAPVVPDLELPAAALGTAPRNEPATVPQPAVRRNRYVEAVHKTPTLGTQVEVEVEPALVLTDADITDPVPSAEAPNVVADEPTQVHTLEIPDVAPAPAYFAPITPEPTPIVDCEPEPKPIVDCEPEPLPEPRLDHTELLPPVEMLAKVPLPEPQAPEPTPPPPPRELTPPPELEFLEGETVLAAEDDEDEAIPFELTSRTPPPAEIEASCVDDFPLDELTQSAEEEEIDDQWDETAVPLELQEALPDIDLHELQHLADLPPRPLPDGHAAPRYAPRRSDVSELLTSFGVGEGTSDRDVCRDLKLLAGIEQTSNPPLVALSETPPPVAVSDDDASLSRDEQPRMTSRALIGAAVVGLVVAGAGFGSIPLSAGTPVAAAATVPSVSEPAVRMGESHREAPCVAEIEVTEIPARARVELRAGPDGQVVQPKRGAANGTVFAGLPCREAVDVMLELPGRRWLRVPVAASELTPSDAEPSLVRHSVAVR
jgi:hypothetical protein